MNDTTSTLKDVKTRRHSQQQTNSDWSCWSIAVILL